MGSIEEIHELPPFAPPLAVLKSHAADIQAAIAEYESAKIPDDKARAVTNIAGASQMLSTIQASLCNTLPSSQYLMLLCEWR